MSDAELAPAVRAYVKQAHGPDGTAHLMAEAAMLDCAAHPGVVEVLRSQALDDGGWQLELGYISGGDLTARRSWSAAEVAGFGAAAATTVADLHDLGIVHGRLGPEHVLVDGAGRPLLCGFGGASHWERARRGEDPRSFDVSALARCLIDQLPGDAPRELRRVLAGALAEGRRRPPTARHLATALSTVMADPRLPGEPTGVSERPEHYRPVVNEPDVDAGRDHGPPPLSWPDPPHPGARRRRRGTLVGLHGRTRAALGVAAGLLVVAGLGFGLLAVLGAAWSGPQAKPTVTVPKAGAACPPIDQGCRPLAHQGDVLATAAGRYRIGARSDVVVLGRWTCGLVAYPALLRPATGQVWVFDAWARPGFQVTARRVGTVSGGRSLRVVPSGSGCDRLEVLRRSGAAAVLIQPGRP